MWPEQMAHRNGKLHKQTYSKLAKFTSFIYKSMHMLWFINAWIPPQIHIILLHVLVFRFYLYFSLNETSFSFIDRIIFKINPIHWSSKTNATTTIMYIIHSYFTLMNIWKAFFKCLICKLQWDFVWIVCQKNPWN